ncbi:hypothetical protein MTR_5g058770 [Medicago truncatula]|uniref:Uncharacterized protein n=1 Tax=Medicago truncatula TaxID=3880 RepID=G7K8U3_MEDTR|nr:hypothetical protein MTR_5g058770 [Medicago truncatula]
MARTKGLAKKGNVQSSSSSKTPPDLNHTPPSSPHFSDQSTEFSLSPTLSQIPCEETLDIQPLNMIEDPVQEEEEITPVKTKSKPKPKPKKTIDEGDKTVHEIPDSDEEEEAVPEVVQPKPVATSKNSKTSKPKSSSNQTEKPPPKTKISKSNSNNSKKPSLSKKSPPKPPLTRKEKGKAPLTSEEKNPSPQKIPLLDPEQEQDFYEKWAPRPIAIGRYVDFEDLDKEEILLRAFTDKMGWTHFLQIREKTYKKVVQAFYSQAKAYSEKSLIISTIKGKQISLTPEVIAQHLNLPSDGLCVYGEN